MPPLRWQGCLNRLQRCPLFSFMECLVGSSKVLEVRLVLAQTGGHIGAFSGAPADRAGRGWLGRRSRGEGTARALALRRTDKRGPRRRCGRRSPVAAPKSKGLRTVGTSGGELHGRAAQFAVTVVRVRVRGRMARRLRRGGLMARVPDEGAGLARAWLDR